MKSKLNFGSLGTEYSITGRFLINNINSFSRRYVRRKSRLIWLGRSVEVFRMNEGDEIFEFKKEGELAWSLNLYNIRFYFLFFC